MNTITFEKKNVKMVAHRGVSGLETENTCAAFVAAGNRSYYAIETDVYITPDGKYPVFHDPTTLRLTGVDKVVSECTLEELQSLPLFDMEEGVFRTDLKIATMIDYIRICKRYGKKAVLELKPQMTTEQIKGIIDAIKELDYLDEVIFISFWDNVVKVRELLPNQKLQALARTCDEEYIQNLIKYRIDLDIYFRSVTKELVDVLHKNNLEINCWTVDQPEDAERLVELGVDYITTNILE